MLKRRKIVEFHTLWWATRIVLWSDASVLSTHICACILRTKKVTLQQNPVHAFSKATKFQTHPSLTAFQLSWHVKREHRCFKIKSKHATRNRLYTQYKHRFVKTVWNNWFKVDMSISSTFSIYFYEMVMGVGDPL